MNKLRILIKCFPHDKRSFCKPSSNFHFWILGWSAHNNAIFDIAWSPGESRLISASGDQSAALWDVKTASRLATFKQHRCSLKSVSFRPVDCHVFATGARDGSIMVWDDRSRKKGMAVFYHLSKYCII